MNVKDDVWEGLRNVCKSRAWGAQVAAVQGIAAGYSEKVPFSFCGFAWMDPQTGEGLDK